MKKIVRILIVVAVGCFVMTSLHVVDSFAATQPGQKAISQPPKGNVSAAAKHATPAKKQTAKKTVKRMSVAQAKSVQEALNKEGFKLKVDGIVGKHTRAALKGFQKKNRLKATGRLNRATLAKLGLK